MHEIGVKFQRVTLARGFRPLLHIMIVMHYHLFMWCFPRELRHFADNMFSEYAREVVVDVKHLSMYIVSI